MTGSMTDAQVIAAVRDADELAWNAAIEAAAKACETEGEKYAAGSRDKVAAWVADDCAAAVRRLKR